MKICIIGGGVSGLTAAHYLSNAFEVHVFERTNRVGGLCSSAYYPTDFQEICWHAFADTYANTIKLLNQMESYDKKTVASHLIEARAPSPLKLMQFNSSVDMALAGILVLFAFIIPTYFRDKIKFKSYIKLISNKKNILGVISTYFGLDANKVSLNTIMSFFPPSGSNFYLLDGPMDKVWFEPWVEHLKSKGVNFHYLSEVLNIDYDKQLFEVNDQVVVYDKLIMATDINGLAKLDPRYTELLQNGRHKQIQVVFAIDFDYQSQIDVFTESPWYLMLLNTQNVWNDDFKGSYICVGIGRTDVKGSNGKTADECSHIELIEEVKEQLGFPIKSRGCIWDDPELVKFSDNVNTLYEKPPFQLKNIYYSSAYVGSRMFNIESAVSNGKYVANLINQNQI